VGYHGLNMPFSPLRAGIAFLIAGLLCYISLRRSKSTRTRGTQLYGERASLGLMGAGVVFAVIWLAFRRS
jgi:hypothetical protein